MNCMITYKLHSDSIEKQKLVINVASKKEAKVEVQKMLLSKDYTIVSIDVMSQYEY
jgi:hypothetical protein